MTKREAGRLGGQKTAQTYGSEYMRKLGTRGAKAFHARYRLDPLGQNDFAIVDRQTDVPLPKTLNGRLLS